MEGNLVISKKKNIYVKELFKSFEQEILVKVKDFVEIEKDLLNFEIAFSTLISKEKIEETNRLVNEVREKDWEDALKNSNGDRKKAIAIFSSCKNA